MNSVNIFFIVCVSGIIISFTNSLVISKRDTSNIQSGNIKNETQSNPINTQSNLTEKDNNRSIVQTNNTKILTEKVEGSKQSESPSNGGKNISSKSESHINSNSTPIKHQTNDNSKSQTNYTKSGNYSEDSEKKPNEGSNTKAKSEPTSQEEKKTNEGSNTKAKFEPTSQEEKKPNEGSNTKEKFEDIPYGTEQHKSHFFAYAVVGLFSVLLFYVLFQKKKKILGLIVEGYRPRSTGTRSRSSSGGGSSHVAYKPLPTDEKSEDLKKFIF